MVFLTPEKEVINYDTPELLGYGLTGIVLSHGIGRARKIPKIRVLDRLEGAELKAETHMNEGSLICFELEKEVYARLHPHDALAGSIEIGDHEIIMDRLDKTLDDVISDDCEPDWQTKNAWIASAISVLAYTHERNVLVDDIALRNYMLAADKSLKMVDFGQCTIFPLDIDILKASDEHGYTIYTDIFHLGCVIYSIASWTKFELNLFNNDMKWPPLSELPQFHQLPCKDIIEKCWLGQVTTMELKQQWMQRMDGSLT